MKVFDKKWENRLNIRWFWTCYLTELIFVLNYLFNWIFCCINMALFQSPFLTISLVSAILISLVIPAFIEKAKRRTQDILR